MRYLLIALFALLAFLPASAQPLIHAHPALWHVKGPKGEAYLLGSIHLLPKNIVWRTGAINAAIARSDVFVFEASIGEEAQEKIRELIAGLGQLPPGRSLRAMLPENVRPDFDAALAKAHLPERVVDHEKPWLVSLQLLVADSAQKHYSQDAGVDRAVMQTAEAAHKPERYFETVEQQLRLLAGSDDRLQLDEFASDLKDFDKGDQDLDDLVAAWSKGDAAKVGALMNEDLADQPDVKKALLTDRNQNAGSAADRDHAGGEARLLHHRGRRASGRRGRCAGHAAGSGI